MNIVLGITGGIAAYKAIEILRKLAQKRLAYEHARQERQKSLIVK